MFSTRLSILPAAFVIAALFAVAARAEPAGKTVVLVHGAFADGSNWSKVIPLLEAKGLKVVAVQNPLSSLSADVQTARRVVEAQNGPVILVATRSRRLSMSPPSHPERVNPSTISARVNRLRPGPRASGRIAAAISR